ncbi:zinc-binding protein A33-like isoform X2 [Protopterus annectens]|uniref:zinc-binding protein A33-like isoform X2 n=1 Tax=Protopterus annectens TaxID=7888 RepID=UPI001CFB41ED|nr:zinc-binding protein A33-like isoform X2 [Protopterus annectens]
MVTKKLSAAFTEDLLCPVCLGLFKDPVMLDCRHLVCKSCIDKVWTSQKPPFFPSQDCRKEFTERKYIIIKASDDMKQKVLRLQPGENAGVSHHEQKRQNLLETRQCMEHEEAVKLFCLEDRKFICHICRVLSEHEGHTFLCPKEAVSMFQGEMETTLASKINHLKKLQGAQKQEISNIQDKAQSLEEHIKSECAKMRKFLWDKEHQLIQQLREESRKILEKMERKLSSIERMKEEVQKQISGIQSNAKDEDPLLFLTDLMDEGKRQASESQPASVVVSGNLSLGVYKGPLQYKVWREMLSAISLGLSHLTVDQKTAHHNPVLLKKLTSIKHSRVKQLSDSPERYDSSLSVQGSLGVASGRHYWEVEVENKTEWSVGVTRQARNRRGQFDMNPQDGYWAIVLNSGNEYWAQDSAPKDLRLTMQPKTIGVYLDYEGGQVSFYNADNMSHLYTFTNTFTEAPLYPFFSPYNNRCQNVEPLKMFHLKLPKF